MAFSKNWSFLDPYFSLSKLVWILEKVKISRPLHFGTLDTYILWVLSGKNFLYRLHQRFPHSYF